MSGYIYTIAMILGFGGLSISSYIHRKKASAEPMVCPIGSNCEVVVHSDYSELFHIPLEMIGAFYYTIMILTYSLFLAFPELHNAGAAIIILEMTTVAFLFSLYLIYVQAVIIKEWCTWCLGSGLISSLIFLIELKIVGFDLMGLIQKAFF